jgi:hypothetical protein
MGHYGEFGCALWSTVADFVIRYGPLKRIDYALWATAWNEAIKKKSILIFALRAIAQDLVMSYGPRHRI